MARRHLKGFRIALIKVEHGTPLGDTISCCNSDGEEMRLTYAQRSKIKELIDNPEELKAYIMKSFSNDNILEDNVIILSE